MLKWLLHFFTRKKTLKSVPMSRVFTDGAGRNWLADLENYGVDYPLFPQEAIETPSGNRYFLLSIQKDGVEQFMICMQPASDRAKIHPVSIATTNLDATQIKMAQLVIADKNSSNT